jgi:O-methyltransferase
MAAIRAEETDLSELARQIVDRRLSYLTPERLSYLMDTVERVNADGIEGDLAEFGIALGGSAICVASKLAAGQKFYGFDNFDLIPRPGPVDGEHPNARYEVIKSGRSAGIGGDRYYGYERDRLALVTRHFAEFGMPVDDERIVLVNGLFEDTLAAALQGPIAFAHVDCDWYAPVKICLEALHSLLRPGASIVVDDYRHWDGCTKATDEFCAAHTDIRLAAGPSRALLTKL